MPNWQEVLEEVNATSLSTGQNALTVLDDLRRNYLRQMYSHTGRNVIAYYSGFLQKPNLHQTQINDDDKNSFMMAIHGMNCREGLDLILHTPGGVIEATESIVDYLYRKFGDANDDIDIRVIVPQIAMSAGTMMACSAKQILMGRQSSLGPIDPHLSGLPAHGVIAEFKRAFKEIKSDPTYLSVWQFPLQKYHPTFLSACENAIELSEEFVERNLKRVMLKNERQKAKKAKKIVAYLNNYKDRKTHARHINIDECRSIGLNIQELENDQILQNIVLTIHHCYMHTLQNTNVVKILENHNGATRVQQIAGP